MRTPKLSGLAEQMKEKRGSCCELVQELTCAKIAIQMRLPGPEDAEHDNEEYELAEHLPDPPQVSDFGPGDPMAEPRFSGMYFKYYCAFAHTC